MADDLGISFESKILSPADCLLALNKGSVARPVVFTNGVFDILHRGHISYLDRAARLGNSLVVAVNTDDSVRRLGKGDDRPINSLADRLSMLAALASVDLVTWFDEDTPIEIIRRLRPEIIVKGGDYDMAVLPETDLVKSWGGKAIAINFDYQRSTTSLLKRIRG